MPSKLDPLVTNQAAASEQLGAWNGNAQSSHLPVLFQVGSLCDVLLPDGSRRPATIISRRVGSGGSSPNANPGFANGGSEAYQYYIHRDGDDKRLDCWVDHSMIVQRNSHLHSAASVVGQAEVNPGNSKIDEKTHDREEMNLEEARVKAEQDQASCLSLKAAGKRKRIDDELDNRSDAASPVPSRQPSPSLSVPSAQGEKGNSAHSSITPMMRNIDRVFFGAYDIKTWYYSPYPLDDDWADTDVAKPLGSPLARKASGSLVVTSKKAPRGSLKERSGLRTTSGIHDTPEPGDSPQPASPVTNTSAGSPVPTLADHSASQALRAATSTGATPAGALSGTFPSTGAESPSNAQPFQFNGGHSGPRTKKTGLDAHETPKRSARDNSIKSLYVCDGCFKYMRTYSGYALHKKQCTFTHPPGRKVYQRGAHIIWEVDGAEAKLYCQNLSLFGKLFIDHKTIYFDVEPFTFYVLTDASSQFDHVLGFFSKEKLSYDDYNLACIITFPPFQKKGFGTLMIEFSYYLSADAKILGTPERPLSDLGLKGYLSYWTSVVLRALALAYDDNASPCALLPQNSLSPTKSEARQKFLTVAIRRKLLGLDGIGNMGGSGGEGLIEGEQDQAEARRLKRVSKGWAGSVPRNAVSVPTRHRASESPSKEGRAPSFGTSSGSGSLGALNKAFDSPASAPSSAGRGSSGENAPLDPTKSESSVHGRSLRSRAQGGSPASATHGKLSSADGSIRDKGGFSSSVPDIPRHPSLDLKNDEQLFICTSLENLSRATNLRVEDIAFTLVECGLLDTRVGSDLIEEFDHPVIKDVGPSRFDSKVGLEVSRNGNEEGGTRVQAANRGGHPTNGEGDEAKDAILLTKEAIRKAMVDRKVKRPVLDEDFVLI
ncbi:acyl-CoA N-acyltransferase [Violaceomyces palustris]|uniref:Acyl-CoA N-acyltransferase n=1 Tax=Violaceomyces palustris TaxID=1673888 RepID=A0ACD0NPP8_9BASI|nr:acyl-CoA N-acyltransferase [Violaceomyces palustris]